MKVSNYFSPYDAATAACPVCDAIARKLIALSSFDVLRCILCGHTFAKLTDSMQDSALELYASDKYGGFRDDPIFRNVVRNELATTFAAACPPPAYLLDVGCGNGAFLEEASEAGYRVAGIDSSAQAVKLCQERGFEATQARVGGVAAGQWDVITYWDVLEHLPDPVGVLAWTRLLLNNGGTVVIKVPTFGSRLDQLLTLTPRLSESVLQTPAHVSFFSETSVLTALTRAGFSLVSLEVRGKMRAAGRGMTPRRLLGRAARSPVKMLAATKNLYAVAVKR